MQLYFQPADAAAYSDADDVMMSMYTAACDDDDATDDDVDHDAVAHADDDAAVSKMIKNEDDADVASAHPGGNSETARNKECLH